MPATRTARLPVPIRPLPGATPAPRRALLDHPISLALIAVAAAVVLKALGSGLYHHVACFVA